MIYAALIALVLVLIADCLAVALNPYPDLYAVNALVVAAFIFFIVRKSA